MYLSIIFGPRILMMGSELENNSNFRRVEEFQVVQD